ncbi:CorA family divalent cation transporter [Paraeggerthella sp.]
MQILTVVTSIFMPLTLITGWYGMNFKVMPELGWSMSYFVLIAVAIVIVTVEIIIFKRNKWF